MNILITGGLGFIGKNLVEFLSKNTQYNIITLDIKESNYSHTHYKMDIRNYCDLTTIKEDIDIIYHLAAQSYGKGSLIDPMYDLETNIKGTYNIIELAKLKKVKKIIYSSSMAVYGNRNISYETDNPNPLSDYGVSKLAGEYYIKKSKIPYTIFRLYNTYGKHQDLKKTDKGIVFAFASQLFSKDNKIKVTGSLERYRDIINIQDVVEGLYLGLNDKTINEVYNLCTNKKTTVYQLINLLIAVHNKKNIKIENIGGIEGDQFGNVGCHNKLLKLGWYPKIKLDQGIKDFYLYIKENI